jgi:hypothetical protein
MNEINILQEWIKKTYFLLAQNNFDKRFFKKKGKFCKFIFLQIIPSLFLFHISTVEF